MDKPQDPDNVIKLTVDKAGKPKRPRTPKLAESTAAADPFADRQHGNYAYKDGLMHLIKLTRVTKEAGGGRDKDITYQPTHIPLTINFAARITRESISDDGITESAAFEIEARDTKGRYLPTVIVPAAKFSTMNWLVETHGSRAVLTAGTSIKDHVRVALLTLSGDIERVTTYQHVGWRKVGSPYAYLSTRGALSGTGLDESVTVSPDQGRLNLFALPVPPSDGPHQVAGALRLLDLLNISPSNPALGAALLGCPLRAVLCECAPVEFSLVLYGRTGSQKSECASIAQALFGAGFADKNFAGSFARDTAGALGRKLFLAKDAILVLDDCKATTERGARELQEKAEAVLHHAVGNRVDRDRLGKDSRSGGPSYWPRGLAVLTAETLPTGESLRARMLTVVVQRGQVDLDRLTLLQEDARTGRLAEGMSAYLAWLAPKIESLRTDLPKRLRETRQEVRGEHFVAGHPRSPDIYANLRIAFELFTEYLIDIGAADELSAVQQLDSYSGACIGLLREQVEHITEQDEVRRFLALLQAVLSTGSANVADRIKQNAPALHPSAWGWRIEKALIEDQSTGLQKEIERPRPLGDRIGWLNEATGELYLNQAGAFSRVSDMARRQGEPLLIKSAELWRQMLDRNYLSESDTSSGGGRPRPGVKKSIGGVMHRVAVLRPGLINPADSAGAGEE